MKYALRAALIGIPLCATAANAQIPVDLNAWKPQSYPAVSGFTPGNWVVAGDNKSVRQIQNGQPTMFSSDFNAHGTEVSGKIRVNSSGDDDFIGFALGYHLGDVTNPLANYLLVDWKQVTQQFDFGSPSTTPGTTAPVGLAVSRVTGIPTADEFWGHTNFAQHTGGGLEQLQRGFTRGSTGWVDFQTYDFRFVFLPTLLQVFVDNTLEISINGDFANGSMAFYNFSQSDVTYSAFTVRQVEVVAPEPASFALMAAGLLAMGVAVKKRRRA